MWGKVLHKITRKKTIQGDVLATELHRCLSTFDLVVIGVSNMMGSGIYVLSGVIAHHTSGPALPLCFLVAAIASSMSASCYAEFASRVPKAGSAYIYTYITMGELAAFLIGWNVILEHIIAIAALSRGLIGYLNTATHESVSDTLHEVFREHDWDPYVVPIILTAALIVCLGVKSSALFNTILTTITVIIASFVVISGTILADFSNWHDFLPYGPSSIFEGAAQAYFAFVGLDVVATASEEALNPFKTVPRAIGLSLLVVSVIYILSSAALTLMVPYTEIVDDSALSAAFVYHGWKWAEYIITFGALAAMTGSLLGTVFAVSRCTYALAVDGTLFKFLAKINSKTQTPIIATLVMTSIAMIFAFFLPMEILAELLSMGTLLAYFVVALATIMIRYHPLDLITGLPFDTQEQSENARLVKSCKWERNQTISLSLFLVFAILTNLFLALAKHNSNRDYAFTTYVILICVFSLLMGGSIIYFSVVSQENPSEPAYKVPFNPFMPAASIFVNFYLITHLKLITWVLIFGWVIVGLVVYATYGNFHSVLEDTQPSDPTITKEEKVN